MLKALLIDLDGTLANSLPLLYQVYQEFLTQRQLEGSIEEFNSLNGLTLLEVMEALVNKHRLSESPEELSLKYRGRLDSAYHTSLPIFPFARECLIYAREKGLKLALVTSAKESLAHSFLKQHQLEDLIQVVITPEEGEKGKPAPDIYLRALKMLQLEPKEAIALEDAEHGMTAALEAGIPTVQFHGEQKTEQPILFHANNWAEFFDFLKKQEITHSEFRFYPIDETFQVNVKKSVLPSPLSQQVEAIWEEKCSQNPQLFNGKIFRFLSLDKNGLSGEFVDYKNYIASLHDPSLEILPVSVTGIVYTDEAVLIGKRSSLVSVAAGLLETPPSGTIDPEAQVGTQIDIIKQLKKELFEETNLTERDILQITPFAFIEDKKGGSWEICFMIPLKEIKEVLSPNWEYDDLFFVPRKELLPFIEERYEELLPFTRYLLSNMAG